MVIPKVIYYKHKTYKDGSHPVIIQVIKNRKAYRITVAAVQEHQWDEASKQVKKHPLKEQINNDLRDKLTEVSQNLYDAKKEEKDIDYSNLLNKETSTDLTFTEFFLEIITTLQSNLQVGTAKRYRSAYNLIILYSTGKQVRFSQVTHRWLTGFNTFMIGRSAAQNTRSKMFAFMRTAFNKAIKQKLVKSTPFSDFEISYLKTTKEKLSPNEFEIIKGLSLKEDSKMEATRDFFVLAVYLRGIRVSDLLQVGSENIIGDRLIYVAGKTGHNYNIKLLPEAITIVKKYTGRFYKLFPFFNWHPDVVSSKFENEHARMKHCESQTAMINLNLKKIAGLAGIDKKVTTHIARHTFAKMAIDKIGNPRITMGMLGHTSLAVHEGYIRDLEQSDELDAAADKIFG